MGPFLASAVSGQLVLVLLPSLPPFWWTLTVFPLLLLLWRWLRRRWLLWPVPALLTFSLAVAIAEQQLDAEVPTALEQQTLHVLGNISGLPEADRYGGWRIRLHPLMVDDADWAPRGVWQLNLKSVAMPLPDARCTLTVRLKKPHGNANPGGFDYEAWLLSEGVTATGTASKATCERPGWSIDQMRLAMRLHFQKRFSDQQDMAGVVLALITGDRALVSPEVWERYAATGVIHLMAISGMHITLLAVVAAWLALRVLRWVPGLGLLVPLHKLALLTGLGVALGYSLIAGFSIPTQRTLVMLAVVGVAHWWQRRLPALQVLGVAMLAVLLWWPLSVHAAGFWLSFGAVALLMLIGQSQSHLPAWKQGLWMQLGLSVLLLPPTVWFFERASWVSPFANLLAVPVVTFLVVPLGMLGMLLWMVSLPWADNIWLLAIQIMTVLDALLAQFQLWPGASIDWSLPGRAGFIWALLAVLCLAQPLHPRLRALAPLFLLPIFMTYRTPFPGSLRVTVLDVGQGLAVLLETGNYRLLYDAGAAFGEQDAGRSVILPALRQHGIKRLDRLVLSHDDLDHTGGAASVLTRVPVTDVLGAWPASLSGIHPVRHHTCAVGEEWQVEGWRFTVLSPSRAQAEGNANNDQSCALRVSKGQAALLLPGDMEAPGEYDLLDAGTNVNANVLVLGHHGAQAATTTAWLHQVKPDVAIASAGYHNRYGHPSAAVQQRLAQAGVPLLNTATQGAIFIDMRATGDVRWQSYRAMAGRYWW
jgi:competence protein ComEC